jgi:hypothetical protein
VDQVGATRSADGKGDEITQKVAGKRMKLGGRKTDS